MSHSSWSLDSIEEPRPDFVNHVVGHSQQWDPHVHAQRPAKVGEHFWDIIQQDLYGYLMGILPKFGVRAVLWMYLILMHDCCC